MLSTEEVLTDIGLDGQADFLIEVREAFQTDAWVACANGSWTGSHPHELLSQSWYNFAATVRNQTRYFFQSTKQDDFADFDEVLPADMLPAIARLVERHGLVVTVGQNTQLYRARVRRSGETWTPDAKEMGAPPASVCRAGRMNPAGIAYLYLALEQGTALAETVSSPPVEAVVATFETTRPLNVLDLTRIPALPSLFDEKARADRESLLFLHTFVRDITRAVSKDSSDHVDYVPTQVMCEYFAQVFVPAGHSKCVDGLLYRSAVRPGGRNLVLFPNGHTRKFDAVNYVRSEARPLADWRALASALDVAQDSTGVRESR